MQTLGLDTAFENLTMGHCSLRLKLTYIKYLGQASPRLQALKATLQFEEKFAGRKEKNSTAIKRLVCCSNRTNFCCSPAQVLIPG